MSVLIKGMEMPKKGVYFAVISFDGDSLSIRIPPSKKPFFDGRIEEIPTPHGRLIDADNVSSDAMCSHCVEEYCRNNCECFIENVQTILSNELITPTIIEAEVSE